jgi:regulator of protease activity HflC (stomatin/prohibitin superfamily)
MLLLSLLLLAVGVTVAVLRRRRVVRSRFAAATGLLSGVVGLLLGLATFTYVVAPYEVGVPTTLGTVGGTWQSGLHPKSPLTDVTTFSTRPADLDLTGKDTVEVRSSEGGVLYADLTVKWSIDPAHTLALFKLAGSAPAVQQRLSTRTAARSCATCSPSTPVSRATPRSARRSVPRSTGSSPSGSPRAASWSTG